MSDTPVYVTEYRMSDPQLGQPPPRRELPQTTLQFAGQASEAVMGGLTGRSPYMLGIVVLNMLGIAAAIYFLNILITGQQKHLQNLLEVQDKQQTELITLHKQEFDLLLGMIPRYEAPVAPVATAPSVPTQTAPVAPLPAGRR